MAVTVLIIDDNAPFLALSRELLEREGMQVVGVATTSAEALRYVELFGPDVTLVDIDLGGESGLALARQLTERAATPVVLISAYPEQDLVELVESSSAVGFVAKSNLSANAICALLGESSGGTL